MTRRVGVDRERAVALGDRYATGRTGAPGTIFWTPSTMTLSPGLEAVIDDPLGALPGGRGHRARALTLLLSAST